MKEQINEYTTGYPSSITNSQSQEYQGVLGPVDAEAVQGKDRFNPETSEGIHRLNVFLKHFFKKPVLNPHYEIAQLRARLNHLGYDFKWNNETPVNPSQTFNVGKTDVFGATPTTDLSKGFDTGSDLPVYNLTITCAQTDSGFKMDGMFGKVSQMEEAVAHEKQKRSKRIETVRKIMEQKKSSGEAERASRIKDPTNTIKREARKEGRRSRVSP